MRSEGTVVGSVCVCLSVCLSVTLHLTSRMIFRPTNDTTYLMGNEGQNFRAVFTLKMLVYGVKHERLTSVDALARRHQKLQRRTCIAFACYQVASPCLTVHEQARDHEYMRW